MKRLDFKKMLIGLDQLMLQGKINNQEQAAQYADAIDNYLETSGWTWDDVLEVMSSEIKEDYELVN